MGPMAKLSRLGIVLLGSMPLLSLGSHSNHLARHNSALKHSDAPFAAHGAHMLRRDDYTCSADRPCENGACCGSTGNCGYGDTYCGKGCQSNCDAKAECGKDASPRGKKCPLNTCCSEFGFCGTTKDFCKGKCQSNCNLDPEPPEGSPKNKALSKIIGYYESWSDRLACHQMAPSDLPLSEMTHLNYAFAYINPKSFEVETMDSSTPKKLFTLTVDAKNYNPDLKVWVSIGGWTFSDNNTATQPVFGDIAGKEANRQKFADNVVRFMNSYGFDGLDIDWEYPGAPDRGGKTEDTKNYVALMKTLRSTFDKSTRDLGLSFTIPSSYWYLRWFDMPGMMKYADWTNMMSYDLHGTWDRKNAIGSIVQGHTNMTEIKQAAELLWRVGIKPEQVVMGFGFYGRSFKLEDPSCTTPGCNFKGDATPGSCSSTSGILMYYEIQALLDQDKSLKPVHDQEAAVNYFVYDNNQWVSYDNGTTFQQKLAWANETGIGGSLIWASDTDDDKYSAMRGLLDKSVSHPEISKEAIKRSVKTVTQNLVGQNGQDCKRMTECVDPDIVRCPDGWHKTGWDKAGCGSGGKLICCPTATAPRSCTWRGSGGDCNGQCHAGEATLFKSSWGGGFDRESGTARCSRGAKVFCCDAGDWKQATQGCYWSHCAHGCKKSEKDLSGTKDGCFIGTSKYCCPKDTPIHDCGWRGSKYDCEDAKCNSDEVAIRNDQQGNSLWTCSWGRRKTDCCKVTKAPPPTLKCKKTTCDIDPGPCVISATGGYSKRDVLEYIEKRGSKRPFSWPLWGYLTNRALTQLMESRSYPGGRTYMQSLQNGMQGLASRWFRMSSDRCGHPNLVASQLPRNGGNAPDTAQVEHTIPLAIVPRFTASANWGRLYTQRPIISMGSKIPIGRETSNDRIQNGFWQNTWTNAHALPADLPRVNPTSPDIREPSQRIYEALGSDTSPAHFTLLQDAVNSAKNMLENFKRPQSDKVYKKQLLPEALKDDEVAIQEILAPLRETVAVFQYLNEGDVVTRMDTIATSIYHQLQLIEEHTEGSDGLAAHWNEFYPAYFSEVSYFARTFTTGRIAAIRNDFRDSTSAYRDRIEKALLEIEDQIPNMYYPFEDKP